MQGEPNLFPPVFLKISVPMVLQYPADVSNQAVKTINNFIE